VSDPPGDPVLTLYSYWRSSAAYRTRIALGLKGLPYELVETSLVAAVSAQRSPAYLRKNPQGLVPALGVGDDMIGESLAIIEYLDEAYPQPALLPDGALPRAQVRWMAQAIACDIHPLNNLRVLNYLRSPLGHGDEAVNAWVTHWISAGFAALEELALRFSTSGTVLYGSAVTLADVCLVPQMYNARRFNVPLAAFPTLTTISSALEALPAFASARPELQPAASA
jgi:maleylacetoacetate isomerase